nr:reverse transcriptase domain-containing protein [Tanacetum cinerariifolium]
ADIPLWKRARFTTPTGGYEVGESSVVAVARQFRPALTIADSRRADDRLIGRLRRERRYFHTLSTTYAQEVAHSRDYYTQIMDYCQSREVHTSTLVTQMEALQRDVSTLQRKHIDDEDRLTRHIQYEHAQRDVAPEDGDRVAAAMAEAEASRVRNGYGSNGLGPRLAQTGQIKKLETEMWELKTKGTDVIGYSRRFQELALMCDRTFPEESDRVEKYIGGVPDMIHDSVKATKPKTMQEAIELVL